MTFTVANPVVRLPDPPIESGPFVAMWRTDGRLAIVNRDLPLGTRTVDVLAMRGGVSSKSRQSEVEDRARARISELVKQLHNVVPLRGEKS